MRSIKTTVTAAAVLSAGFVLAAPAAHAATAPLGHSACASAVAAAEKARHDFKAAAEDLKEQVAAGGHPGVAEEQNLADLLNQAKAAVANAIGVCKDRDRDRDRDHCRHPHGAMHTGVGSMSQGVNGGEVAGGLGILGAAGAGALVLRRRRAGSEG